MRVFGESRIRTGFPRGSSRRSRAGIASYQESNISNQESQRAHPYSLDNVKGVADACITPVTMEAIESGHGYEAEQDQKRHGRHIWLSTGHGRRVREPRDISRSIKAVPP